jgi:hypothetical protein
VIVIRARSRAPATLFVRARGAGVRKKMKEVDETEEKEEKKNNWKRDRDRALLCVSIRQSRALKNGPQLCILLHHHPVGTIALEGGENKIKQNLKKMKKEIKRVEKRRKAKDHGDDGQQQLENFSLSSSFIEISVLILVHSAFHIFPLFLSWLG